MTTVAHPPRVSITVGPPVPLGLEDATADTALLMAAITELLPAEARVARIPTEQELARTQPPA
jgi:hypothetical protein